MLTSLTHSLTTITWWLKSSCLGSCRKELPSLSLASTGFLLVLRRRRVSTSSGKNQSPRKLGQKPKTMENRPRPEMCKKWPINKKGKCSMTPIFFGHFFPTSGRGRCTIVFRHFFAHVLAFGPIFHCVAGTRDRTTCRGVH